MEKHLILKSYLNEIKIKGYSEKTILNRKKILEKFLKKYDFPDKISTYNFLSEIKVSKNSMSTYATYIRVFAKYWQDSTNDIFKLPEVTKMSKKEKTYLTKAELNKLISSTENDRDSLIIEFLANTGLRIGELTKLTKKDFDFENNVVKVCGKGDKERTVPLNTEIAKKIKEYIEKNEDNAFVFHSRKNGSIATNTINYMLRSAAKKAGLEKHVTPHILRHTFATQLLGGGVNITSVQKLLGHSSINTTAIYLHVNQEELKKAVETLVK